MENAASALRMAGAILIFVLAFILIMNTLNSAKNSMDTILYSVDETNFYQHVGATENNITRTVGLETIIPTLYTYVSSDETIRINIVASDGTLVQVFDATIESAIKDMNGKTDSAKKEEERNGSTIYNIWKRYYNDGQNQCYPKGVFWTTSTVDQQINRITAYIYGLKFKSNGVTLDYSENGNNLITLAEDGNAIFYENYVEYQKSGTVYWNDNHDESLVVLDGETKTVITYIKK